MSGCASKRKAVAASLSAVTQKVKKNKKHDGSSSQSPIDTEPISFENILFCDGRITLSEDFFSMLVLDYLSRPDLVHRASLVSKSWNQSTKNPHIWTALTADIWNIAFSSAQELCKLLQHPQFAKLKKFVPPEIYGRFIGSAVFDGLAKGCPLLEELDVSKSTSRFHHHCLVPRSHELSGLPGLFPCLQKLRVSMRASTPKSLGHFASHIGERLLELSVLVPTESLENALDDETIEVLAENCPNLKVFIYENERISSNVMKFGCLSERGPIALLRNCPHLKELTVDVTHEAYPMIMEHFNEFNYSARGVKLHLHSNMFRRFYRTFLEVQEVCHFPYK